MSGQARFDVAGFWGEFPAILAAFNPGENAVGDATVVLGLNVTLFRVLMVIAAFGTVFAPKPTVVPASSNAPSTTGPKRPTTTVARAAIASASSCPLTER